MTPEQMARIDGWLRKDEPDMWFPGTVRDAVRALRDALTTLQQEKAALEAELHTEQHAGDDLDNGLAEVMSERDQWKATWEEWRVISRQYQARAEQAEAERDEAVTALNANWVTHQRVVNAEALNVQQQVRNGELCGPIVELGTDNRRLRDALEWCAQAVLDISNAPTDGPYVPRRTELRDAAVGIFTRANAALAGTPEGQS